MNKNKTEKNTSPKERSLLASSPIVGEQTKRGDGKPENSTTEQDEWKICGAALPIRAALTPHIIQLMAKIEHIKTTAATVRVPQEREEEEKKNQRKSRHKFMYFLICVEMR